MNLVKLVKIRSKKTYKGNDGKDYHYYNFHVVLPNGKSVPIKCINRDGYLILEGCAEYVKTSDK